MRPDAELAEVLELAEKGFSTSEIARRTGIPRRTVVDWQSGSRGVKRALGRSVVDVEAVPPAAYAYVLGLYLGDGCISRSARTQRLRITLDEAYPDVIDACLAAVGLVMPGTTPPAVVRRKDRAVDVSSYGAGWLELLPQHGSGPKHLRRIALETWQETIVRQSPRWFLKGLFDSDGCYVINRVRSARGRTYAYDRYFFTNRSDDIRSLFVWACELIGAEARETGRKNVSVAQRDSVAILNAFLGPKR